MTTPTDKMRERAVSIVRGYAGHMTRDTLDALLNQIAQALAAERAMALEEAARDAETLEGGLTSASRLRALADGEENAR